MSHPIRIVGAGMAGLIAGSVLRGQVVSLHEAQPSLPNNHSALLRFRSSVVGDAVGIPFKRVKVMKAVHMPSNPVADVMMYSAKVGGKSTLRSITTAKGEIEERFIAPDNMIQLMASGLMDRIKLGDRVEDFSIFKPTISTMPMPTLMSVLGYPHLPKFQYRNGWTVNVDLPPELVDACVTLYYPNPRDPQYRASITLNRLIIEGAGEWIDGLEPNQMVRECMIDLGLFSLIDQLPSKIEVKPQRYAKIMPIDESLRKRFILWASETHGVYSLGRFATWRPSLMLDDLINDIRVIQRMISGDSSTPYNSRKA